MYLIIFCVLLLLLKWGQIGPFADIAWVWVWLALGVTVLWFEVVEPVFGLDKRRAHNELEQIKKERIRKQLEQKK